jgi:hypothetical protein
MAGTGGVRAEQAGALLLSLLTDGPKSAAEILSVAEGAKIAKRTIQLAATQLGVIRSKADFGAGWIWGLPVDKPKVPPSVSEGLGTEQADQDEGDKVQPRGEPDQSQAVVERAQFIAAMLNKREERRIRERGRFHWQDDRVQQWAAAGIRDYQLKEAYDLATSADEFTGAVTVGLLARYLESVLADEGGSDVGWASAARQKLARRLGPLEVQR